MNKHIWSKNSTSCAIRCREAAHHPSSPFRRRKLDNATAVAAHQAPPVNINASNYTKRQTCIKAEHTAQNAAERRGRTEPDPPTKERTGHQPDGTRTTYPTGTPKTNANEQQHHNNHRPPPRSPPKTRPRPCTRLAPSTNTPPPVNTHQHFSFQTPYYRKRTHIVSLSHTRTIRIAPSRSFRPLSPQPLRDSPAHPLPATRPLQRTEGRRKLGLEPRLSRPPLRRHCTHPSQQGRQRQRRRVFWGQVFFAEEGPRLGFSVRKGGGGVGGLRSGSAWEFRAVRCVAFPPFRLCSFPGVVLHAEEIRSADKHERLMQFAVTTVCCWISGFSGMTPPSVALFFHPPDGHTARTHSTDKRRLTPPPIPINPTGLNTTAYAKK